MTRLVLALIAIYGLAAPVCGQNIDSPAGPGREIEIDGMRAFIPDVVVVDHKGRRRRLYSDLIKERVVLIHFFYTRCTYTCSLQGQELFEVQTLLGERQGKEVFMISVSMDPGTDNPKQLSRWAKAYRLKPGWTLVSSASPEIRKFIKLFTGNPGPVEMHAAPVFIGNDKMGVWRTLDGFAGSGNLFKAIEQVGK